MNDVRGILIAALGNPGKRYENTRHNIGFMFADKASAHFGFPPFQYCKFFKAFVSAGTVEKRPLIFIKPDTYMNLSGKAVLPATEAFKVSDSDLYVVHDDLDIKFGNQKIKLGGRDAGHKGIRSIISELQTDQFYRIRLGIGKSLSDVSTSDYVLDKFLDDELSFIQNDWSSIWNCMIKTLLSEGPEKAMNDYNARRQKG
jgi:peptidyl-tRNA hydrolase, PTH1 family